MCIWLNFIKSKELYLIFELLMQEIIKINSPVVKFV